MRVTIEITVRIQKDMDDHWLPRSSIDLRGFFRYSYRTVSRVTCSSSSVSCKRSIHLRRGKALIDRSRVCNRTWPSRTL